MFSSNSQNIEGIKDLLPFYDTFIFGLWGVLYEGGERPLPGVIEVLLKLKKAGKNIIILSNSSKPSTLISSRLSSIGISKEMYDGILSSGDILYYQLQRNSGNNFSHVGGKCLHIGKRSDWYFSSLYERVFDYEEADFILINRHLFKEEYIENYLPILKGAIEKNLPMLSVFGDSFYYEGDKAILGSGSFNNKYEKLGGLVIKIGKPDKKLFLYCLEGFPGSKSNRTIVIGDSIETDIKGAEKASLASLFIAGGKHARELDLYRGEPIDFSSLEELCRFYGSFPTYSLSSLQWSSN